MNEFAPPYVEQIPLPTLLDTLDMYEEMLGVLEDVPSERSRAMRRDILQAREIVQMEVIRRRLKHITEGAAVM